MIPNNNETRSLLWYIKLRTFNSLIFLFDQSIRGWVKKHGSE